MKKEKVIYGKFEFLFLYIVKVSINIIFFF